MLKRQALFILFLVSTSQVVCGELTGKEKSLFRLVESSGLSSKNLGLAVSDEHGQLLFQLNSDKQFIPASLTKIVTAAAALEKLPVGHQFVTAVLIDVNKIKEATLSGDIYLRGGGDAGFVSESMWFLVNEFKRTGITEITGDIVVDDSRFDSVRFDLSRDQDRVDRAYDSPIGAMTFNWSAVNIFIRPGESAGAPARVFADPESRYISVINKTNTTVGKKTNLEVRNTGFKSKSNTEEIVVSGSIGIQSPEFIAYKSIGSPDIWAGQHFYEFLKQRGVSVKGQIRSGVAPKTVSPVALYKSKTISDSVASMMKFSNNYIAEIITKNLGAEIMGVPGTMENGVQVLRSYLKENDIADAEIYNPSGLTRKNKFKPNDLLKILLKVKNNFRIYPEYLSGLPIAGVDGTLKRRLGEEKLNGHVRAKTGHLSGVAGLGGFVSGANGTIYSFIFLFNGKDQEAYKSKDLFDKLIIELLKP